MRKITETQLCDQCGKKIEAEKAIKSVRPDLDLHGIWMGDIQEHIWFDEDLSWCSWACFIAWLDDKRKSFQPPA